VTGEEGTHVNEEDDLMNKYGFKQRLIIDMQLPSGEREIISDYYMQFVDRNAANKDSEV
jgi:hypothetical protein